MKLRHAGITATVALLSLGVVAQVQGSENRGHSWQNAQPDRSPMDPASDRLMQEAFQRIDSALEHMQQALPIYNGHREEAIEDSEKVQLEIRMALMWGRMYEPGRKASNLRRTPRLTSERERKSHEHMVSAGVLLREALDQLELAQADYGGYKRRAIESARNAALHAQEAVNNTLTRA
ncbi:MAG: hypothetical protein QM758_29600 [Armatimonas sp.]